MAPKQTDFAEQLKKLDEKVDKILAILIGNPDDADKPGLVERLRGVEKWQSGEKWGALVLGGLFLTDLGIEVLKMWKGR
jgi:hypothetical protein